MSGEISLRGVLCQDCSNSSSGVLPRPEVIRPHYSRECPAYRRQATTSPTRALQAAGSLTSQVKPFAFIPCRDDLIDYWPARLSVQVDHRNFGSFFGEKWAVALPIPDPAPVTSAAFPAIDRDSFVNFAMRLDSSVDGIC